MTHQKSNIMILKWLNRSFVLLILLFLFVASHPPKNTLSIISWNIRDFGKTKDETEIETIAQIVKDFDLVVIQEVVAGNGGAQAVARLADQLNRMDAKWDYAISDPTIIPPYKTERYAFLWKPHKLQKIGNFSLIKELEDTVYREPYMGKFKFYDEEIYILNYHSRKYDDKPEVEVKAITEYMLYTNPKVSVIAGDFNLKENEAAFNELYRNGYSTVVNNKKTTLKRTCSGNNYFNHPIDNIFIDNSKFSILESGVIDFVKDCENLDKARKISDHLPVYCILEPR